jgi:hypothetical protein
MPRYFFNFESANSSVADLIGRDLPHEIAARSEAAKVAAELATNDAVEGRPPSFEWIEVVDESHRPILRLPIADAIREPNRLR